MSGPVFQEEILGYRDKFARLRLLDATLREGEQTPGVSFTIDQKIDIAKKLDELGVHMIEAGHPAVAPDVKEAVSRIAAMKRDGEIRAEIVAHSRAVKSDIDVAADVEPDRIAIFYGVSDIHLKSKHRKSREEALQIIGEMVEYAKSYGVKVRFTAEDASRADVEYLEEVVRTARDAGADRVSLADTVGVLTPWTAKRFFEHMVQRVPNVEYDIHVHNDLGMAVATAFGAVMGGATVVHVTVNGLGERVGIVPLQTFAVAVKVHFDVDLVNLSKLMEITRMVERYSGLEVPYNAPVIGDYAFIHKAGVHVAGILADPRTYEAFPPELIGRSRDYVIDKYTGKKAVKAKLEKLGIRLSDDELLKVLEEIKRSNVKFLTDDTLVTIAEKVTGRVLKPRVTENLEAIVWIKVDSNAFTSSVARKLSSIEGVREVAEITGDYDLLVKVVSPDHAFLNSVLDSIRNVKGVESTHTQIVLKKIEK
ncbi:2-isopropylmalate synthase [Ignicoccus islandicus DSM 13165]|uniref:Homocitrate synthase n=1 Tax=Ignicoccus islandicus DSM 13165 TaxID=940295 RepID=A0A0U3DWK3_9CREN|nr:homocitrate synthase [Ignicoccus islandicus]ALU11866.1 2-isopropylmalate synthase [Ignicoccus islandicus DSM 13165]